MLNSQAVCMSDCCLALFLYFSHSSSYNAIDVYHSLFFVCQTLLFKAALSPRDVPFIGVHFTEHHGPCSLCRSICATLRRSLFYIQNKMLQGSNILGYERPLVIRVSFSTCVLSTVFLPLLGLITCLFISSVFHFDDSTVTHCQVPNYLPSISASISLSPEGHIWRFCIGLHSAPRLLVTFTYFKLYKARFASKFPESPLSCLNLVFSMLENLGLLLLTYVSSSETYFIHKEGFVLFIISSLIYMLITCRLWKSIKRNSLCPEDAKSHRWKVRFLLLNVSCCAFAGFFYWKHNMYCESGSYTLFALFEYLIVFSNMAFHLTAVWDFKSREVMVISSSEDKTF